MDSHLWQNPTSDESADDTYDEIAHEAKATAFDKLASQPARDHSDEQNNQKALIRHMHCDAPHQFEMILRLLPLESKHCAQAPLGSGPIKVLAEVLSDKLKMLKFASSPAILRPRKVDATRRARRRDGP